MDGMKAVLEEMPQEQFEEQKQGLERKWLEADKNLSEEASRYLAQIQTGHLDFLRSTLVKFIRLDLVLMFIL